MVVENPKNVGIHTTMIDLKGDLKFCTDTYYVAGHNSRPSE